MIALSVCMCATSPPSQLPNYSTADLIHDNVLSEEQASREKSVTQTKQSSHRRKWKNKSFLRGSQRAAVTVWHVDAAEGDGE